MEKDTKLLESDEESSDAGNRADDADGSESSCNRRHSGGRRSDDGEALSHPATAAVLAAMAIFASQVLPPLAHLITVYLNHVSAGYEVVNQVAK